MQSHVPSNQIEDSEWGELEAELSDGAVVFDSDIIASSSRDITTHSTVGQAAILVRAKTIEDVQVTLRFAHKRGIAVVPQGALTGTSGAANAVDGGILLNTTAMNQILEIDSTARTATVQPGVINQILKNAVEELGMSYPPDPGSVAISTIGGNVATNAGGLCCVKYGVTRDYVRNLKVVLADGTLTHVGRTTVKNSAGLDLCNLFIGSEGTLGVIVEITLDLVPALPPMLTGVATFPDEVSAAKTVEEFMASDAEPAMLELLDRTTLELLNDYKNFDLDASDGAVLFLGTDGSGSSEIAERELEQFVEIASKHGAIDTTYSTDPEDTEALTEIRRAAQPAWAHYVEANGGGQLLDDICVPRSRIAEFYEWLAERKKASSLVIGGVAHAGDGNLHPMVAFDKSNPEEVAEAQELFEEVMELGINLGGTISGEHGIGILKSEWLVRELDQGSRTLHRAIKDALDPKGIMNPSKMFSYI